MAKATSTVPKQLALVTGASSGIGLALARLFAQNNYDLVIAAEDAAIEDAATELRSFGGTVEPVQVDLATREGVDRCANARFIPRVYNATKAFVQSFSEASGNELKDTGATTTALQPGATDTNFFARARWLPKSKAPVNGRRALLHKLNRTNILRYAP